MRRSSPRLRAFACSFLAVIAALTFQTHAQVSRRTLLSDRSGKADEYTLTGKIINSITGEAVSRALVQIYAGRQRAVFSNDEGLFQFDHLPRMQTMLNVRKPGFFSTQELNPGSFSPVEIGPTTQPVVLKLVPEALITAHVEDANGEPLEGIQIRLTDVRIANGRKQWQQRGGAITNEDGNVRIANLVPGSYYVAAEPSWDRDLRPGHLPGDEAYPLTYYQGAAELSAATPIRLSAGQAEHVDFVLKLLPTRIISGFITGFAPGQAVGAQLINTSGESVTLAADVNPSTGKFQARVAYPGPFLINANAQDASGHSLHAEMMLSPSADMKDLQLDLAPTLSIPISVRMETTKPPNTSEGFSGVERLDAKAASPPPIHVHFVSTNRVRSDTSSSPEGTDPDSLAVRNVEPGRYIVEAQSQHGLFYVKSARYGDLDLLREPIVVVPGESKQIEIVMADDGATLKGQVHLNDVGARAAVLIVEDDSQLSPKIAIANDSGEFYAFALAPGQYSLFAFDHADQIEYTDPEALRAYAPKATRITLQPNESAPVKLDLIRTGDQ